MNPHVRSFVISQAIIWLPLFLGRSARKRGWLAERIAPPLHSFNLIAINPLVIGLGVWQLDRSMPDWIMSPILLGLMLAISTVGSSWLAHRLTPRRERAGTLAIMMPLSNVGHTMAGFITILLLPFHAFGYHAIYMWMQTCFIFLVWLPLARLYGTDRGEPFWRAFGRAIGSAHAMPLWGMLAGTALNAADVPMAPACKSLLRSMVFIGTVVVMFAMGLQMKFHRMRGFDKLLRWVYLVKFVAHPVLMALLCLAFGVHGMLAGVLIIASFMPAGVFTVAISALYDLDVDLANAGYLWTTVLFMILVLPFLILVLQIPYFR